ncbi:hypothetical protein PENTCL1PPCAC_3760, partial [Pristionchus entomophagus]
ESGISLSSIVGDDSPLPQPLSFPPSLFSFLISFRIHSPLLPTMSSAIDRSNEAAAKNKIKKRRNPRKSTQYISLNARKEPSRENDEPPLTPISPLSPHSSSSSMFFPPRSVKPAHSPSGNAVKFTFTQTISIQQHSDPIVEEPAKREPAPAPIGTSTTIGSVATTNRPVPPPRRNRRRHHVMDPRGAASLVVPEPIVTHF